MLKKHSTLICFILILVLSLANYLTDIKLAEKEEPVSRSAGSLQLTFVDVGQGDAAFIRTTDGETWLIDGGEDAMFEKELKPFLDAQNADKLDYAVVTHYHNDHTGGIFQLLKAGRIKTLILPDYVPDSKAKSGLLKNAEITNTTVSEVSAGDILNSEDKNLKLSVLHPEKGGFNIENENSNSIVLRLDYFDTSALLTGDLEEDAEYGLVKEYDLEVDILKVAHHGSSSSTGDRFFTAADPTYAVISAGENNRYGHPHYEVLDRLENDDVRVYRTDQDGDITFILDQNGINSISTEE